MPHEKDFTSTASYIREIAECMLDRHFGPRCEEFEPECECCKRWKALDDLTENPYAD